MTLCCYADEEGDEERGVQGKRARGEQWDIDSEDEAALDALLNEARRRSGSRYALNLHRDASARILHKGMACGPEFPRQPQLLKKAMAACSSGAVD
jgi:hypothetical protein